MKSYLSSVRPTSGRPVSSSKEVGVGKEEVVRWEESKKWQKKVDMLKTKLKEKSEECERLTKTNNMIREQFARLEKDKLSLQVIFCLGRAWSGFYLGGHSFSTTKTN